MGSEFVYQEEYRKASRGVQLFTCRWLPLSSPKALVFLCHGYGVECSIFMKECGEGLAGARYAVFGVDYEGHGRSEGKRCHIEKFEDIINDCEEYFKSVIGLQEYAGKQRFLYGESMGGGVALRLHQKDPSFWNGAVLLAPMAKTSERMKPNPLIFTVLSKLKPIIPNWLKLATVKDIVDAAYRDPVKLERIKKNTMIYQERPRLKTAIEVMRGSLIIEDELYKVSFPFLVLHGEADKVVDPEVSWTLYERASSRDKTIKLYPGMCHGLTAGEPDHNVQIVLADIITWLDTHITNDALAPPLHE